MNVKIIKSSGKDEYDFALDNLPEASFLQSWEWGQWQEFLGHKVIRTLATENNKILAASQWVQLPPRKQPVWYAPRGPVFSHSAGDLASFFSEHKKIFPSTLAFRIEPNSTSLKLNEIGIKVAPSQPEKTIIIDISMPENELLAGMREKTRYNIRLAQKRGVAIKSISAFELSDSEIDDCLDLLHATAERQKFRDHPRSYTKALLKFFGSLEGAKLNVKIYFAAHENDLLCSAVMIDYAQTRMYMYGGSSDLKRNVMAPHLLHWQVILDAKKEGFLAYDLGGLVTVNKKTAGFTRFKQGFGGTEVTYKGTWDIPLKPLAHKAYSLARTVNRWRLRLM